MTKWYFINTVNAVLIKHRPKYAVSLEDFFWITSVYRSRSGAVDEDKEEYDKCGELCNKIYSLSKHGEY